MEKGEEAHKYNTQKKDKIDKFYAQILFIIEDFLKQFSAMYNVQKQVLLIFYQTNVSFSQTYLNRF